jgi:MFS family permease
MRDQRIFHLHRSSSDQRLLVTPILMGALVAFGATDLLATVIDPALVAIGQTFGAESTPEGGTVLRPRLLPAGALTASLLVGYFLGGYSAGRMAPRSGPLHGVLVAVAALLIGLVVSRIAAALGAPVFLQVPFTTRVPFGNGSVPVDWGFLLSAVALAAMFVGGAFGGTQGERRDAEPLASVRSPD